MLSKVRCPEHGEIVELALDDRPGVVDVRDCLNYHRLTMMCDRLAPPAFQKAVIGADILGSMIGRPEISGVATSAERQATCIFRRDEFERRQIVGQIRRLAGLQNNEPDRSSGR